MLRSVFILFLLSISLYTTLNAATIDQKSIPASLFLSGTQGPLKKFIPTKNHRPDQGFIKTVKEYIKDNAKSGQPTRLFLI
jgi:hypothetical protein